MYKSSYDGGLSKKDIKRIQEIVNEMHAASMREDLKDVKYVEGYIAGRKSVISDLKQIAEFIYSLAYDVENGDYDDIADEIADIRYYGDMLLELAQDIERGE